MNQLQGEELEQAIVALDRHLDEMHAKTSSGELLAAVDSMSHASTLLLQLPTERWIEPSLRYFRLLSQLIDAWPPQQPAPTPKLTPTLIPFNMCSVSLS